ncbi:uncharacterized protein PHACADRAFT_185015 [Phanerochaete carnosa HHB-10118-sp]|uniref:Uncharacterized protein n=1 Tax=Phanerochaete carnosa (strain HHB-10118-sp) TaxID=650164 RepID=K5W4Z9_PHACS|nr:uncharacterized protein PHACADRAFT_185015 [Phanerochaete carnosa HHB-10118-sp]EKM54019.1 hypothetical protein PHACADRAFT_185015 [Phanerochaete carnosa HHB-10118-sp]
MPYRKNIAEQARLYLNSQLRTHWKISSLLLAEARNNGIEPNLTRSGEYLLAEYHYNEGSLKTRAAVEDLSFYAKFTAPTIDWMCNHEAVLIFKIEEGHCYQHRPQASLSVVADNSGRANMSHASAAFRVPYKVVRMKAQQDEVIGYENSIISDMLVFDYEKAKLTKLSPEMPHHKQSLAEYFRIYLQALQSANHHALVSLPYFILGDPKFAINFSQAVRAIPDTIEVHHGMQADEFNYHLLRQFFTAATLARAPNLLSDDHSRAVTSLAEYRGGWATKHHRNVHFRLEFSVPHATAVCDQEIIMHFLIGKVLFYGSEDFEVPPRKTFHDWTVTILFRVKNILGAHGCREIDISSGRYMHQFSTFNGCVDSDKDDVQYMKCIIGFIKEGYPHVLERAKYHIIYDPGRMRPPTQLIDNGSMYEPDSDWSHKASIEDCRTVSQQAIWRDISQSSSMRGFDLITALSQVAINMYFHSSWARAQAATHTSAETLLLQWKLERCFEAEFKPPIVHLCSNRQAIVILHLKRGFLKPLRTWASCTNSDVSEFEDWRVAFEVELKMCDHSALTDVVSAEWQAAYNRSRVSEQYGTTEVVNLKHVCLDLQNATFLREFSRDTSQNKCSKDHAVTAVAYLRDHYLKQLVAAGHHIICSVPVLRKPSAELRHLPTSVAFEVSMPWWAEHGEEEPIVVVLARWLAGAGGIVLYGIVAISVCSLPVLSEINAKTTVVFLNSTSEQDISHLELTCLADHPERKAVSCPFSCHLKRPAGGPITYRWEHRDECDMAGPYSVECGTENYLEITPRYEYGAMEFKLRGSASLVLFANTSTNKSRRLWSNAIWEASFRLESGDGRLKVIPLEQRRTRFSKAASGKVSPGISYDPEKLLRGVIPEVIDVSDISNRLRVLTQTCYSCYPPMTTYTLAQPAVNHDGDLVFELRPCTTLQPGKIAIPDASGAEPLNEAPDDHSSSSNALTAKASLQHLQISDVTYTPLSLDWMQAQEAFDIRPMTPVFGSVIDSATSTLPGSSALSPGGINADLDHHFSPRRMLSSSALWRSDPTGPLGSLDTVNEDTETLPTPHKSSGLESSDVGGSIVVDSSSSYHDTEDGCSATGSSSSDTLMPFGLTNMRPSMSNNAT